MMGLEPAKLTDLTASFSSNVFGYGANCGIGASELIGSLICFKSYKPDYVFHLAAQSLVKQSYIDPKYTLETNSIGLKKKPSDTTVVVAMSGGVDSSTVAGIMKKEGYNVIGITLKLYDDGKEVAASKQCCSGQDIMDAKRVAHKLNIDHKILYYQDKFKQGVIDNFVESYLKGETPIPCVQCNQTVKFKDLFDFSKDLNADALITGHYVKSLTKNNQTNMYRALDANRDQSYFLFNTTREQLNFLRFPLGGMLKDKTREIAKNLNLNVADKPDSQDICFVPNGDYASVIEKFKPDSFKKGNIKDIDGKVLGVHDGIINFTIGQRKGIKIAHKEPLYVVDINSKENKIIVGPKEALVIKKIYLRDVNILDSLKSFSEPVQIKVRSTGRLIKSRMKLSNKDAEVYLYRVDSGPERMGWSAAGLRSGHV